VVGIHRGAYTGGVPARPVGVSSRPPLGLVGYKLEIHTPTINADREIVIHVILFPPTARLTRVIGVLTDSEVQGSFPRTKRIEISPNLIQELAHFELKLQLSAPPWPGKNLFFL
jgi:hypothetical protein